MGVVVEIEPFRKNLCLMVWAFGKLLVHEWDKLVGDILTCWWAKGVKFWSQVWCDVGGSI